MIASEQSKQQWAEHIALWGHNAQCVLLEMLFLIPDWLGSHSQEVQDPAVEGGVQAQLSNRVMRNDFVECWTEVYSLWPAVESSWDLITIWSWYLVPPSASNMQRHFSAYGSLRFHSYISFQIFPTNANCLTWQFGDRYVHRKCLLESLGIWLGTKLSWLAEVQSLAMWQWESCLTLALSRAYILFCVCRRCSGQYRL